MSSARFGRLRAILAPAPAALAALCALLSACDRAAPPGDDPSRAPPPPAAAVDWVTLVRRSSQDESVAPREFRVSGDTVRVITEMGALASPYSPGVVITNLLAEASLIPQQSVRAERRSASDSLAADTAVVTVRPGTLLLYIARHQGLRDWRVTVQERTGTPR